MRITTPLRAAAIALAIAAIAAPALAQMPSNDGRSGGMARAGETGASPFIAELDFKGGPFDAFVEALRAAAGEQPVNIVFPPEAAGLPVPPVSLRDVDVYTALRSAQPGATNPFRIEGRPVIWRAERIAGEGAPVYIIEVRDIGDPRMIQSGRPPIVHHTAVHTITELTTGSGAMSADDVLSAIQAALAIEGADDETKIRYHEETGLVFARVTPDQGSVIEQTLVNMRLSMQARERNDRRSQIQQVLDQTNSKTTDELISRVRMADDMRNRVLELQRTIAELQTHIINLQGELDRRRAGARDEDRD